MWVGGRKKLQNQATMHNVSVSVCAYCKQLGDQTAIKSNTGNRRRPFYWLLVV